MMFGQQLPIKKIVKYFQPKFSISPSLGQNINKKKNRYKVLTQFESTLKEI